MSRAHSAAAKIAPAVAIDAAPATEAPRSRAKALPMELHLALLPSWQVALQARHAAGLSQDELARATGAPRRWVQRWECRDGDAAPRIDHIERAPVVYQAVWARYIAARCGRLVVAAQPDGLQHQQRQRVLTSTLTDVLRVYAEIMAGTAEPRDVRALCAVLDASQDVIGSARVSLSLVKP